MELPFCEKCGDWRIGRSFCAVHPHDALGERTLSGPARVFSFTVSHVPMAPGLDDLVPYTVALLAFDEGPRVLAHWVADTPPQIGDEVVVGERDEQMRRKLPGDGLRVASPVEGP